MTRCHLELLGVFLGRPLLLTLPQMVGDGDSVHAGRHSFRRDPTELLPVRVVLVESLDHLGGDAFGADAGQFGHLLSLGAVGVHGSELASSVTEQHQEVIGLAFIHFLQKMWIKTSLKSYIHHFYISQSKIL